MTNPTPDTSEQYKKCLEFISYAKYGTSYKNINQDKLSTIVISASELDNYINRKLSEAYKKGYIRGGIDEILRHEKAVEQVKKELENNNE